LTKISDFERIPANRLVWLAGVGRRRGMQLDIAHVCIIVRDLERAMERFRSIWGTGPFRVLDSDHPDGIVHGKKIHYSGRVAFAQAGPIEIELIEPGEGESIWWEFLRDKGEGVHHVAVFVPDLQEEMAKYKEKDIEVLQTGETERVKLAYMDTKAFGGVIVELLEKK
jgi:methylmalonyl-CoA/ethylmalonyl-CoA epimerase